MDTSNIKALLCILVAGTVAAGCATSNVASDFDPKRSTSTGVAVGSITYEGGYGAYRIYLQSVADKKSYRIEHGSSQTLNPVLAFKGETPDPVLKRRGSVFAVELPAGDYSVSGWQIRVSSFDVFPSAPTGLTFKVEPGKSIYRGNFDFVVTDTFMRNPTRAEVKLSDNRAKDIESLKVKFPRIAAVPLEAAIADGLVIERIGGSSQGRSEFPIYVPIRR